MKVRSIAVTAAAVLLPSLRCFAIEPGGRLPATGNATQAVVAMTGSLRTDLLRSAGSSAEEFTALLPRSDTIPSLESVRRSGESYRSPWLAAGLSALLPGAGQFYSGSYLRSATFLAAEAALWTGYLIYNSKGDRQTNDFQNYADQRWSVVEYANWINTFNPDAPVIHINSNTALSPWQRVDWNELNAAERAVGQKLQIFTHWLPPHGEQQYYELIGKYAQYNPGWDDADRSHISSDNVSPHFHSYSLLRGKANDYYDAASTLMTIVFVNHVLSTIEAAWTAARQNRIHAEVGLHPERTLFGVVYNPTASVSVTF